MACTIHFQSNIHSLSFRTNVNIFFSFNSYRSQCLNDFPLISSVVHEPKKLYGKLTGQVINRDEQCKMIHGRNFYACPQQWVSKVCKLEIRPLTFGTQVYVLIAIFKKLKRYHHHYYSCTDILWRSGMYKRWLRLSDYIFPCRWNTMRR